MGLRVARSAALQIEVQFVGLTYDQVKRSLQTTLSEISGAGVVTVDPDAGIDREVDREAGLRDRMTAEINMPFGSRHYIEFKLGPDGANATKVVLYYLVSGLRSRSADSARVTVGSAALTMMDVAARNAVSVPTTDLSDRQL
jgi:hypothetical protein